MTTNFSQDFINFSRPFIEAAKIIFETMISTKIVPQKPAIKNDPTSQGDISAMLGLSGPYEIEGKVLDFRGLLVISWPYNTYVNMANTMLGESHKEFNDQIADAGAEIANMIMGNAKRDLANLGYKLNMAIPSTVSGKGHIISYPPKSVTIAIPIDSAHGPFYIEICYSVAN